MWILQGKVFDKCHIPFIQFLSFVCGFSIIIELNQISYCNVGELGMHG